MGAPRPDAQKLTSSYIFGLSSSGKETPPGRAHRGGAPTPAPVK